MVKRAEEKSVTSQAGRPPITSRPLGQLDIDRRRRLARRHQAQVRLSQVAVASFNSTL